MKKNILNLALVGALSASFLMAKPAHNANSAAHNTKKTTDASAGVLATSGWQALLPKAILT